MQTHISKSNLPLHRASYPERGETICKLLKDYEISKKTIYPDCCFDNSSVSIWHNIPNYPKMVHMYNMLRMMIFFYRFLTRIWDGIDGTDMERQFRGLKITSCYRSPRVNARVGGSSTSLHLDGLAFDLWAPSDCRAVLEFIYSKLLAYVKTADVMTSKMSADDSHPFIYPYEVIIYDRKKNTLHVGFTYVNPNIIPNV